MAALAFSGVGASTNDGTSNQAGGMWPARPVATPLDGGSAAPVVASTDVLQERKRAVSRSSQRQAIADAAPRRRRPETRAHANRPQPTAGGRAEQKRSRADVRNAWRLPVAKGVYHLTARFGSCSGLWARCHTGLDFAAPTGTPIHAVASGIIIRTAWAGAYGNRTVERLSDGTRLWYAHQSAFRVQPGQKVVAGQEIGLVGYTGNATGPHLHLEVRPRPNHPVDPFRVLVAHGLHP